MSRFLTGLAGRAGSMVVGLLVVFAIRSFIPSNLFIISVSILAFGFLVGVFTNRWYTELGAGALAVIFVFVLGQQFKTANGDMSVTFAFLFCSAWIGEFIDQLAGKYTENAVKKDLISQYEAWFKSPNFIVWLEEQGYKVLATPPAPKTDEATASAASVPVAPPPAPKADADKTATSAAAPTTEKVDFSGCPAEFPQPIEASLAKIVPQDYLAAIVTYFNGTFQNVRASGNFNPKKPFVTASALLNKAMDDFASGKTATLDPDQILGLEPFFTALGFGTNAMAAVEAYVKSDKDKTHLNGRVKKAMEDAFVQAAASHPNWGEVVAKKK